MKKLLCLSLFMINALIQSSDGLVINKPCKINDSINAADLDFFKNLSMQNKAVRQNIKEEYQKEFNELLQALDFDRKLLPKNHCEKNILYVAGDKANPFAIPYKPDIKRVAIETESDIDKIENIHYKDKIDNSQYKALIGNLYSLFKKTNLKKPITLTIELNSISASDSNQDTVFLGLLANDGRIASHQKIEAIFLHELGHIKNDHFTICRKLSYGDKSKIANFPAKLDGLKKFMEFHADHTFACKSIYNARIMESALKEDYGSSIALKERYEKIVKLRKLLEAEREHLGAEWYRREYDRAFYKSLKQQI